MTGLLNIILLIKKYLFIFIDSQGKYLYVLYIWVLLFDKNVWREQVMSLWCHAGARYQKFKLPTYS